uniref:Uncharacterized protein n=1 Tax=Plectus sambesii TaxID=2011161 RepID=A0A914WRR9_9BILA
MKHMKLFLLKILTDVILLTFKVHAIPMQQTIKNAIFEGYDKTNRPVNSASAAVTVQLNPAIFSINEVDVAQQTVQFKQWMRMYWNDEFLTWNPATYGGMTKIMVPRSSIWIPDITIMEQVELVQLDDDFYVVELSYDGNVSSSVDQLIKIHCQFDVALFPFDTQNCSYRFSSWMYTAEAIDIIPTVPTDLTVYNENGEWTMRSYTARKSMSVDDGADFVDMYYDVKMTRKPNYYVTTFIWPSFLITCLSIIGTFAPTTDAGERIEKVTMGLTTLLTMAVILMIITEQMPKSSNGMPLLGLFIMLEIGVATLATLTAVFIIYMHSCWMSDTPVPNCLLALTCMKEKKSEVSPTKDADMYKEGSPRRSPADPKLLVTIKKGVETLNLNINIDDLRDESLRYRWSKATHRLDLIMMIVFLVINCIIVLVVLLVGNAKLNN